MIKQFAYGICLAYGIAYGVRFCNKVAEMHWQ